jgi:hypothetical protein
VRTKTFGTAQNSSPKARSMSSLKRASASRPSGEWNDDDYDVLADGVIVGRIMKAAASPVGLPWTLVYGHNGERKARYCPNSGENGPNLNRQGRRTKRSSARSAGSLYRTS